MRRVPCIYYTYVIKCICTCICVCICICIGIGICICIYTHTYIYIYIHTHLNIRLQSRRVHVCCVWCHACGLLVEVSRQLGWQKNTIQQNQVQLGRYWDDMRGRKLTLLQGSTYTYAYIPMDENRTLSKTTVEDHVR